MTEPSNGEVMRRLDEVARQLVEVTRELRADRAAAASTYVRQDVYAADTREQDRRIGALESENDTREKAADQFRRQVVVAVIGVALPAFGGLVLAVNSLLGGAPA